MMQIKKKNEPNQSSYANPVSFGISPRITWAIFFRNFVGYFLSPVGYLFICLFVLLSSAATFCTPEFFASNLANLDQLSRWFPLILQIFIPSVTMGIWASEKSWRTDELLLTLPARDLEVILGKFCSVAAVYSIALAFSAICNLWILLILGSPDIGLFLANYLGYWLMGLAMLSVGMTASLLVSDVVIAFVLGMVLCAPFIWLSLADLVFSPQIAVLIDPWSVGGQFEQFQRGQISSASTLYFVSIVVIMLYANRALLSRRHWGSRKMQPVHLSIRLAALILVAIGLQIALQDENDVRSDISSEKIATLNQASLSVLDTLDSEDTIRIEAFISPESDLPRSYIQTQDDLLNLLGEIRTRLGEKAQVYVYRPNLFSEQADRAKERFAITSFAVSDSVRGVRNVQEILMGLAITCGRKEMVIPRLTPQFSVEAEVVQTIVSITQPRKKRIGVVRTKAFALGRKVVAPQEMLLNMTMNIQELRPWIYITQLSQRYEIVAIDPTKPIRIWETDAKKERRYDVMMVLQPSTLDEHELSNLADALVTGQPTLILEDPGPNIQLTPTLNTPAGVSQGLYVPGTPGGPAAKYRTMLGATHRPHKGPAPINRLWDLLGVDFSLSRDASSIPKAANLDSVFADNLVAIWQKYNPYPALQSLQEESCVYLNGELSPKCINRDYPATKHLQTVYFRTPGYIEDRPGAGSPGQRTFTPLLTTAGKNDGVFIFNEQRAVLRQVVVRQLGAMDKHAKALRALVSEKKTDRPYCIAAKIEGRLSNKAIVKYLQKYARHDLGLSDFKNLTTSLDPKAEKKPGDQPLTKLELEKLMKEKAALQKMDLNVVLVADLDFAHESSLQPVVQLLRYLAPNSQKSFCNFDLMHNLVDTLAGEDLFVEVRSAKPHHRTLTTIENLVRDSMEKQNVEIERLRKREKEIEDELEKIFIRVLTIQSNMQHTSSQAAFGKELQKAMSQVVELEEEMQELNRLLGTQRETLKNDREKAVNRIQDRYKYYALFFPPLLPLFVAIFVFVMRRIHEHEGVVSSRMRK